MRLGPPAEHHDLAPIRGRGLAFFLIGGIEVGRGGRKLGRAGVDALEYRGDAVALAGGANFVLLAFEQHREASIGEAVALEAVATRRPRFRPEPVPPAPARHGRSRRSGRGTTDRSAWHDSGLPPSGRCGRRPPHTRCALPPAGSVHAPAARGALRRWQRRCQHRAWGRARIPPSPNS